MFLAKFPSGIYGDLARRRLRKLTGGSSPDQTVLSGTLPPEQDLEATRLLRTDLSQPLSQPAATAPAPSPAPVTSAAAPQLPDATAVPSTPAVVAPTVQVTAAAPASAPAAATAPPVAPPVASASCCRARPIVQQTDAGRRCSCGGPGRCRFHGVGAWGQRGQLCSGAAASGFGACWCRRGFRTCILASRARGVRRLGSRCACGFRRIAAGLGTAPAARGQPAPRRQSRVSARGGRDCTRGACSRGRAAA
jgi:hypothetical protein